MNIEYGPQDTRGREFKGEGFMWVLISSGGKTNYAKVSAEGYTQALRGMPFEAWHPLLITPQGLAYMSASSNTIEPWCFGSFSVIAIVHPAEAVNLDQTVKAQLSKIAVYTEGQMPQAPTGPRGIIKE